MIDTPEALYFEGKERGKVAGYALAVIEMATTFRAPHTARKMWIAGGYTIQQATAAGLTARDLATLRMVAPPVPPDATDPWRIGPPLPT